MDTETGVCGIQRDNRCSSDNVTPGYDLQYFQIMEAIKRSLINTLDRITMEEPKTTKPVMFKMLNYKKGVTSIKAESYYVFLVTLGICLGVRRKEHSRKTNSFPQQLEDIILQISQ